MRLVTVRHGGTTRAGRLEGDRVVLLPFVDVGELLTHATWRELAATAGETVSLDRADRAPVVPRPPKIVCLGLNYMGHIREMGHDTPPYPTLFAKFASALLGPYDDLVLPPVASSVDWEVELGVVIGTAGRDIAPDQALDHVAGYTVVNDISVRDWQRRTSQFLQGKTFEATTPVGPELVTADELPPGATGLEVRCEVDGEVVQRDDTSEMIFDVAATIVYLSQIFTLQPGDLISMGTPDGVGAGRHPPVFLRAGQTVRTAIDGIGDLVNRCV